MPTHDDYTLFHGDCFEYLRGLPEKSVDLVLTDPPYGVTKNAWDVKPDIPQFFREAWRVLKPKGVCVFRNVQKRFRLGTRSEGVFSL